MRAIALYCELAQNAIMSGLQQEYIASGGDAGEAEEAPVEEAVAAEEAPAAEAPAEEAPADAS